jgi:nucleoid DNA-binding protein
MNIRLEKIAKELLMNEDCVIIPEFGGFITHYRAAVIEPNKNIILPPGKSISFNSKLSTNDGLLAQNVSSKTGISYNDALLAVKSKVQFWEKELNKTKYLELEGLGSFIVNKEGGLIFEQFNESNFSNSSYGLSNVHASLIKRVGIAERIERGLNQNQARPKSFKFIKASSIAAAAIFFVAVIGFQLNKKYENESLNLGFNTVLPSTKTSPHVEEKISFDKANEKLKNHNKIEPVLSKEEVQFFKDIGHLKEPENLSRIKEVQNKKASVDAKFKAIEKANLTQVLDENQLILKFHVIAGCFGVKTNAIKMVNKLKGEGFKDAKITGKSKSGLLRVSYGSYSKKIVALKALAKARLSHNKNAWLTKD